MPAGKRFLWRDRDGKIIGPKGGKSAYYTEECCCLDGNGCWFRFESVCNETDGTWSEPLLVRAGCMPRPPDAPLEGEPRWRHDPNNRNRAFLWVEKKLTGPDGNPVPCTPENCPGEPPEVAPPDLMCACEPFGLSYDGTLPHVTCRAFLHQIGHFRPGSEVPERTEWLYTSQLPREAEPGFEVHEISSMSADFPVYLSNFEDAPSLHRAQDCWFPADRKEEEDAWRAERAGSREGTRTEWRVNWYDDSGIYREACMHMTPVGPLTGTGWWLEDITMSGGQVFQPRDGMLVPFSISSMEERRASYPKVHELGTVASFGYDQWGYAEYSRPHAEGTGAAEGLVSVSLVRECRGDFVPRQDIRCVDVPLDGYYLPGSPLWLYRAHLVTGLDIDAVNEAAFADFAGKDHIRPEPLRLQADLNGIFCPTYYHLYLTAAWGMCPDDPGMTLPKGLARVRGEHCKPVGLSWAVDSDPASRPGPFWTDGTYSSYDPEQTYWIHETDELVKPPPGTRPGDPDNPDWYDPQSQSYRQLQDTDGHAYKVIKLCIDNYPTWFTSQRCEPVLRAEDLEVPVPSYGEDAYYCQTCRNPYPYPDQPPPPPELELCGWTPENAASSLRFWMDALTKEGSYRGTYGPVDPVPHVGGGVAPDCARAVTAYGSLPGQAGSDGRASIGLEPAYAIPACPDMPYRLCPVTRQAYRVYKKIYEDKDNPTVPSWHLLEGEAKDYLDIISGVSASLPGGMVGWQGMPHDPRRCGESLPDPFSMRVEDLSGETSEGGIAVKYEGAPEPMLVLVTEPYRCCDLHWCGDRTLPPSLGRRPDQGYGPEQYYRAVAALLGLYADQLPDMSSPEDFCPDGYLARGTAVVFTYAVSMRDWGSWRHTSEDVTEYSTDSPSWDIGYRASVTGTLNKTVSTVLDSDFRLGSDWSELPCAMPRLKLDFSLDSSDVMQIGNDKPVLLQKSTVNPGDETRYASVPRPEIRRTANAFGKYRLEVRFSYQYSGYYPSRLGYSTNVSVLVTEYDPMGSLMDQAVRGEDLLAGLTPDHPAPHIHSCTPDPRLLPGICPEPRMWEPANADSSLDRGFAVPVAAAADGPLMQKYGFVSKHTWHADVIDELEYGVKTHNVWTGERNHSIDMELKFEPVVLSFKTA